MVNPSCRLSNSFILAVSVKRTRAMLASNPWRNSRPELIADDGQSALLLARSTAWLGPDEREAVSRPRFTSSYTHRIDSFRMPLKTHLRAPSI